MSRFLRIPLFLLVITSAFSSTSEAQLPAVPQPAENPVTEQKRLLGKMLFWEEQLSSDNTMACGTCHIPSASGADPRMSAHPGPDSIFGTDDDLVGSPGVLHSDVNKLYEPDPVFGLEHQVTGRAAQSFIGSQWAPEMFWDGRAGEMFIDPESSTQAVAIASGGALENQAIGPILSAVEMGHEGRTWADVRSKLEIVTPMRLASNYPPDIALAVAAGKTYPDLFLEAFGTADISAVRIAFAIASYERTLVADQTPWDLFMAGDTSALTQQQADGWDLLENHTTCLNCHAPPLFTDDKFWNIGLRPSGEDLGRQLVTGDAGDAGRFKTPTLRGVGLKSSLMHVGWITSVKDAIDFYNAPAWPSVDPTTGHTQFTQDQTGIPTGNPNVFADYNNIFMPDITVGGMPFQTPVIDFLENGLTDPRVANELPPFDRPTLYSEVAGANQGVFGTGFPGSGGSEPRMIAVSPLNIGHPDFKVGLDASLGGSVASLGLSLGSLSPPFLLWTGLPIHLGLASHQWLGLYPVQLGGAASGEGYGTYTLSTVGLPLSLVGLELFGQWIVVDPGASAGSLSASPAARWVIQ